MDFKHAKINKKLDHWTIVILLLSLCLGFNYLISKLNWQIDFSNEKKYSLSQESVALLNKIKEPVDIILTIKDDNDFPKVMQKFCRVSKLYQLIIKFGSHFLKLILHIPLLHTYKNITSQNLILSLLQAKLEVRKRFSGIMFQLAQTLTIIPKHLVQKMHYQDKQYSNLVFIQIGRKVLMECLNQLNSEVKRLQ